MPMRQLLRRLSEKNFWKRAQSLDVKTEPVPPLPAPKPLAYKYNSLPVGSPPQGVANPSSALPLPNAADDSIDDPRSNKASASPTNADQLDNVSDELVQLWDDLGPKLETPQASKADKALEKIEGKIDIVQANGQGGSAVVNGVTSAFNVTAIVQVMEQKVMHFLEGDTTFMNALDEVEKLHSFIRVAVLAFKTVYMLEVNRRQSDKKIVALHIDMRDMMAVFVQLKDVKDPNDVAPDGKTIEERLQALVHEVINDIRACANACDTYSKKKLVLQGASWREELAQFSETFAKRRGDFEFALAIHTTRSVDAANKKLGEVNTKMDVMIQMFEKLMTAEEKEMAKLVEQKGGAEACLDDDKLLQDLNEFKSGSSVPMGHQAARKSGAKTTSDLEDIKDDLRLEPKAAMKKNMEVFLAKFELQRERMELLVKQEADRVIIAVTAGPHNKIVDPDVREIWSEMGWRGNVKARHFVMALRDYFHDKWNDDNKRDPTIDTPTTTDKKDEWALTFLTVVRLQPLREAFDDDASGLPHWLAYWAIGWNQTLYDYAEKIRKLLSKMFAILPKILKINMNPINKYLTIGEEHQGKFQSYVEAEEARLESALDRVKFDIDAPDTLSLLTGPGRFERFALPLIYILLERHFEIFRLSQKKCLDPDELYYAADTMVYVFEEVDARITTLQSMFKQQKLNVKQEFQTFAHGLYSHFSESHGRWVPDIIRDSDEPYDDALEAQNINPSDILLFSLDQEEHDFAAYEAPTLSGPAISVNTSPLSVLLGPWHGFTYQRGKTNSFEGMLSMDFSLDSVTNEELHFQASGRNNGTDFTVVGTCSPGDTENLINVSLERTFSDYTSTSHWHGQLNKSTDTIMGTCGPQADYNQHTEIFVLKRTAPEYLRFRPSPEQFQKDTVRALWKYACSAIQDQVQRKFMSWKFLKERRDNRKRYIGLFIRDNLAFGRPLDNEERAEFDRLLASFTTADNRFYHSLAQYQIRGTTKHVGTYCDHCQQSDKAGARLICLTCQSTTAWHNRVDLCETPECVAAVVGTEHRTDLPRPHLPTHDFVKVRQMVHSRQLGKMLQDARAALQKSRAIFERGTMSHPVLLGMKDAKGEESDTTNEQNSTVKKTAPQCIGCTDHDSRNHSISQPWWYCVNCQEDTFICMSCDSEKGGLSIGYHKEDHTLVRCQPLVHADEAVSQLSVEDRLTSLEDRLVSIEDRFARVEKLLESKF